MKKPEKYIYPAIFEKEKNGFNIFFPDLDGCNTYGENLEEALFMAKECLGIYLYSLEERKIRIKKPTLPTEIKFLKNQFVQLVEVYMAPIRDEEENKCVRRNVTIPKWLNELANQKKINVSSILESSLKIKLGIVH